MPDEIDIATLMSSIDAVVFERAGHPVKPEQGMTEAADQRRAESDRFRGEHNLNRIAAKGGAR